MLFIAADTGSDGQPGAEPAAPLVCCHPSAPELPPVPVEGTPGGPLAWRCVRDGPSVDLVRYRRDVFVHGNVLDRARIRLEDGRREAAVALCSGGQGEAILFTPLAPQSTSGPAQSCSRRGVWRNAGPCGEVDHSIRARPNVVRRARVGWGYVRYSICRWGSDAGTRAASYPEAAARPHTVLFLRTGPERPAPIRHS